MQVATDMDVQIQAETEVDAATETHRNEHVFTNS